MRWGESSTRKLTIRTCDSTQKCPRPSPSACGCALIIRTHRFAPDTNEVAMAAFFLWIILFILCWPLALIALVLYPFVWLLTLPFRLVGIAVHGVLGLVSAIFMLPVRLLRGPRAI